MVDSSIIVAVIGSVGLVAAGAVPSWFSYKTKRAVKSHVDDEDGTMRRVEDGLVRLDGKLDDVLEWQGQHAAQHRREEAASIHLRQGIS